VDTDLELSGLLGSGVIARDPDPDLGLPDPDLGLPDPGLPDPNLTFGSKIIKTHNETATKILQQYQIFHY
jgi:hypothetical protein